MINKGVLDHISTRIDESISNIVPVSGGDISTTFQLITTSNKYFLKTNSSKIASEMFEAERKGLEYISRTKTIKTPLIIDQDQINNTSYLLLEYVESKSASNTDFELLGSQLAQLHQSSSENFGLDHNNFIGSLPQQNNIHNDWTSFYIQERLLPQIEISKVNNLLSENDVPNINDLYNTCEAIFKNITPSLLHGDLWGGNFIIAKNGTPYLIDPAVYYGHHEVDIAMSKLFGGFKPSFYESYHDQIKKNEGFAERIDLYQLYYLLVHLNLFGVSYYSSVKRIIKTYF